MKTDESLFAAAVEIADPAKRKAFLEKECRGDASRLREIEELVAANHGSNPLDRAPRDIERTGSFLHAGNDLISEGPGSIVGPYTLREQIGEGGMGLVFVAEQQQPVRRKVALKVIKPGMDSRQVVARFEAERQALALMDHPHIAKVLDAGTTETGRPYFVMELVRGVPITEYCDTQKLPPKKRLELFVQVCNAVQHAHQKGVIHRDLKPTNILVAPHDGVPIVKVIDFGVAKALGQQLTEKTIYTNFAQMIGTPLYMSPEQAEVNQLDVDTRSDIYSLGVLLYELLTGTTPFDRKRFSAAAFDEIRRIIREEEPPRPSTRLTTQAATLPLISANRGVEPGRLASLVRGELDWIAMRCLEKDRTRRYETAAGLAKDVQRYLADEAVEARPPSALYRFRKMALRNKMAITTAGLVAASLVLGIGLTTWQAIRATSAERAAIHDRDDKQKALIAEAQQRQVAETEREKAKKERDVATAAREELRRAHYAAAMNLIPAAWQTNNVHRVTKLLEEQIPKSGEEDLRGFEWHYWDRQCHSELSTRKLPDSIASLVLSPANGNNAVFSGDGRRLVCRESRFTTPFNSATEAKKDDGVKSKEDQEKTRQAAFNGGIYVLDVKTGRQLAHWGDEHATTPIALLASDETGSRIAVAHQDRFGRDDSRSNVTVFDVAAGKTIFSRDGILPASVVLSRDGKLLAAGEKSSKPANEDDPGYVLIWKIDEPKAPPIRLSFEPNTSVNRLALSADNKRLAVVVSPRVPQDDLTKLIVCNLTSKDKRTEFKLDNSRMDRFRSLAFSPDGTRLVGLNGMLGWAGNPRGEALLDCWETPVGGAIKHLRTIELESYSNWSSLASPRVAFHPEGRRVLICAGVTGVAQVVDTTKGEILRTYKSTATLFAAAFQPESDRVVTLGLEMRGGPRLRLPRAGEKSEYVFQEWDAPGISGPKPEVAQAGPPRAVRGEQQKTSRIGRNVAVPSPDGKRLAAYISSPPSERVKALEEENPEALADLKVVAIQDAGSKELHKFRGHAGRLRLVNFSPDGKVVVSQASQKDGLEILVWETETGAVRWKSRINGDPERTYVRTLNPPFNRDGSLVLIPTQEGSAVVSTVDWKSRFTTGRAHSAVFSPDGTRLLVHLQLSGEFADAGNIFGDVELWNLESSKRVATLIKVEGKDARVRTASPNSSFSRDGRWIALGGGRVTIWDARTGERHATLQQSALTTNQLIFSPDGKRLLVTVPMAGGRFGESTAPGVFDVESGKLLFRLEGLATTPASTYLFSPDSKRIFTSVGRLEQSNVKVWDGATGRELLSLAPAGTAGGRLELSPDGNRLSLVERSMLATPDRNERQETWDATPREPTKQ
jgi:serine/threonine protein kinase/WD40 repeat protein